MKQAKNKNNSYETEPSSSGSGSSLSGENNDYLEMVEVENFKLSNLLEPKFEYERQLKDDAKNLIRQENLESCNKKYSAPSSNYKSSQESPFRGFRDTPLRTLQAQRFVYPDTDTEEDEDNDGVVFIVQNFNKSNSNEPRKESNKIYETIVIENSCNAVDMPLTSQENDIKCADDVAPQSQVSDLSFNGKIKGLSSERDEEIGKEQIVDLTTTQQFSQSFYKYEASPDLFAADEDDDDKDDDDDDGNENLEDEKLNTKVKFKNEAVALKQDSSTKNEVIDTSANRSLNCPTESSFADEATLDCITQNCSNFRKLFRENCRRERELLRRTRKCLSGVPPPPSFTIPQIDLVELVLSRKEAILNFFKNPREVNSEGIPKNNQRLSLLKPTHTIEEVKIMPWRDILGVRHHGLSYNLSNDSENHEYLSLSVIERFVGAETSSSYRRSPSSAKKRNTRLKLLTQSPGNRLSHLAKRRAIFSSANLATTSQRSATALGPQIVIDKKKLKRSRKSTPKRKTPGSKKKVRKTPSSSARKLQFHANINKPGPTRETSKRALFQSPLEKQQQRLRIAKPQIKPEIATKIEKSKRALFSPDNTTKTETSLLSATQSDDNLFKRKRNDSNYDSSDVEGIDMPSKKLLRTDASCLTPRALKIKSQSFCIGAVSTSQSTVSSALKNQIVTKNSSNNFLSLSSAASSSSLLSSYGGSNNFLSDKKLQRAHSDYVAPAASLTDNQKKKLLWAVSQALQEKKITTKHENFKQFASVLARVVRRIFQEFYQRTSTSNSETLLRLAKKYVFYVISGHNADDIYLQVKAQIEESKRLSTSRLTGYIGPEEYQQRKKQNLSLLSQSSFLSSSMSLCGSLQNLFSNDSSSAACSQQLLSGLGQNTQSSQKIEMNTNQSFSNLLTLNGDITKASTTITRSNSKQRPIDVNANLKNSSSKSNLGSLALRENSGQKNFTGRDQRNVSPYAKSTSALKLSTIVSTSDALHVHTSAKAKRQILFDS